MAKEEIEERYVRRDGYMYREVLIDGNWTSLDEIGNGIASRGLSEKYVFELSDR